MEQPPGEIRTLTTRDLHALHSTVVRELLRGHGFTVLYAGRPLASLLPLGPALMVPATELPRITGHRMERLEILLGQTDLARILGLTLTTFLTRRPGLQFKESTLDRLETLARVIDDLECVLPAAGIKSWFQRASKELKGVSALSTLAFPWSPGDVTITLVEHLARRERLTHLASPTPSSSRRRP